MELLQNPGLPDGDEVVLDSYKCHNFGHTAKYCQKKRKSADIAQRTQIANQEPSHNYKRSEKRKSH